MRARVKRIKANLTGAALLCLSVSLLGCTGNKLNPTPEEGEGAIVFGVAFDSKTLEESVVESKGASTKAALDYKLAVRDAQGRKIRQWDTAAEVPEEVWLMTGLYTIEVEAGNNKTAAFDSPYYLGKKEITVEPNRRVQEEVICYLANALVTVQYSDLIKTNFRDIEVKIGPSAQHMLTFEDESKKGFYDPGAEDEDVALQWTLKLTSTSGTTFTESGSFDIEAGKHFTLEFDVADPDGALGGMTFLTNIVVDEDAVKIDEEIKIPLKRRPEITGEDFDIKSDYFILFGDHPDVVVKLRGTPKIDSVGVLHDCGYLLDRNVPEDFDITGITDAAKNQLRTHGFTWQTVSDSVIKVSLTELIKKLPEGTFHFEFGVRDSSGKRSSQVLTLLIVDSDVMTVSVSNPVLDIWQGRARFRGRWTTPSNPGNLAFEYRKAGAATWTKVTEGIQIDNAAAGDFSLLVKGLTPDTEYEYRAVSNDLPGNPQTLRTEQAIIIPNLNFDDWYKQGNKVWMPCSQAAYDAGIYWFDTGNKGTSTLNANPTTEEKGDVISGSALRMESQYVSLLGIGQFAAGNIYTGRFSKTFTTPLDNPGAELFFGRPFDARPTKLKGYYKYKPVAVTDSRTNPEGLGVGDMDQGNIYIALCDWNSHFVSNTQTGTFPDWSLSNPDIIAYSELIFTGENTVYVPFEIEIDYRDLNRKPKYIVIAASASRFGDYMTGGRGTVLLLDELELIYD